MFAAALIAFVCALALPAVAGAEGFRVNSTADEVDLALGVGGCESAGGKCTLRAAIEEVNSSGESGSIDFDEEVFDGRGNGTIQLASSLPVIATRLFIEGECTIASGELGPCVGIDGPAGGAALIVAGAEEVELNGLAVTGAETGVEVRNGASGFKVVDNWFGVGLDGTVRGNGTGIRVESGSNRPRIGSEGAGFGNVFAGISGTALEILGASGGKVFGNLFGVMPDGITPAANGKNIEIAPEAGFEAVENAIGTPVGRRAAGTPKCDGGCNVIAGSASSGIDLEGPEGSAIATTINANYIGIGVDGVVPVPNFGSAIEVGAAPGTVIGGLRIGESNRINGGLAAITAGAAAGLIVSGNAIGVDTAGVDGLAPPDSGIDVNSEGLSGAAEEAQIIDNQIVVAGGTAISQRGFGATIFGNRISGAGIGIRADGPTGSHGNLIEGNTITGSAANGILLESNFNEVFGNVVSASAGAGIRIVGEELPYGTYENLVGGNGADDENQINNNGGPAISILEPEEATNEVARNRGSGNGGLFIKLSALKPGLEPKGPGKGIQPPTFLGVTQTGADGFGADPGARVRVFRKASPAAGEIDSFLGEAVADKEGEWHVDYGAAIPKGTIVAATQTSLEASTSELAMARTPPEPTGEAKAACSLPSACPVPAPPIPQTRLFKGSKGKKFAAATVAFKFKASISGSGFQCRLDGGKFGRCHSPKVYNGLKPGKHRFEVRATNSAGQADPTPAKLKFTVVD